MKKVIIPIAIILVLTIIGATIFFGVRIMKLNEYKNAKLNLPEGFTITAHTGCMNTAENSLDSIKTGIENGANIDPELLETIRLINTTLYGLKGECE